MRLRWLALAFLFAAAAASVCHFATACLPPPPARKQPSAPTQDNDDVHLHSNDASSTDDPPAAADDGPGTRHARSDRDHLRLITLKEKHLHFTQVGETAHHILYKTVRIPYNLSEISHYINAVRTEVNAIDHDNGYSNRFHYGQSKSFLNNSAMTDPLEAEAHHILYQCSSLNDRAERIRFMFTSAPALVQKEILENPGKHPEFTLNADFHDVHHRSGTRPDSHRQRRGLVTSIIGAIIAAVVAASFSAWLTSGEIQKLQRSIADIERATNLTVHTIARIGNGAHELAVVGEQLLLTLRDYYAGHDESVRAQTFLDIVDRRLTLFENTLSSASASRLHISALTGVNYQVVATDIWKYAAHFDLKPVMSHVSDLTQMDTSFVQTDYGFDTLTLLPLFHEDSLLNVYRAHLLPIPLSDGRTISFSPGAYEYLAVDPARTKYKALTMADFKACRQIAQFYICDLGSVVRKVPADDDDVETCDSEMCLFALYSRRFQLAERCCDTSLHPASDRMVQVGFRQFASFTRTPHEGTVKCIGDYAHFSDTFTANGLLSIELPPGCTAETDEFIFSAADSSFSRDEWTISYEWPLDKSELRPAQAISTFDDLLNLTRHAEAETNRTDELADAIQRLQAAEESLQEVHSTYTPALNFIVLLVLMGLVIWLWIRVRRLETRLRDTRKSAGAGIVVAATAPPSALPPAYSRASFNRQSNLISLD